MKLDNFKNPIFDETDLFELLYTNNVGALAKLPIQHNDAIEQFKDISKIDFLQYTEPSGSQEQFDLDNQSKWFMPLEYYNFDILEFCISKCTTDIQIERVCEEYIEFENRNMLIVLRWLKYFVDTCNEQNVLWGVGRGSSVASYLLYVLGVHRIDSIKYDLDWHEFLRT